MRLIYLCSILDIDDGPCVWLRRSWVLIHLIRMSYGCCAIRIVTRLCIGIRYHLLCPTLGISASY